MARDVQAEEQMYKAIGGWQASGQSQLEYCNAYFPSRVVSFAFSSILFISLGYTLHSSIIEENKDAATNGGQLHLGNDYTAKTVEAFAHIGGTGVNIIKAGVRQVQHYLTNAFKKSTLTGW